MGKQLRFMPFMAALYLLLSTQDIRAQDYPSIKGIVTDEKGQLMPDVSAEIHSGDKTLNRTTLTDDKGVFSFSDLPAGTYSLVFTHLGYGRKTIPRYVYKRGERASLAIEMEPAASKLSDVVVIGYGSVRRKDLTGAVGQANMNDLSKAPVRSFDEALEGRIAGVVVNSVDGQPGSAINIVIRGAGSISQDNSPLYVVDGFPIENPDNNALNPDDIESITVLKDASATAIYGARGANGVIIITTRRGKEGPPVLTYNTSYGFQDNLKNMKMMGPYDFVRYQLERDSTTGEGSPSSIYLGGGRTSDYYKTVKGIDWQSLMFRTAPIVNNSLSLTGGSGKTRYAFSGDVFDQDGTIINSNYKRYQGRLSLDQGVGKNLKVGVNANYSYLTMAGISPSQSSNNVATTLLYSMYGSRPVDGPGDSTNVADDLFDPEIDLSTDYRINPVINQENLVRNKKSKVVNANAYAEYTFLPGLVLRVAAGISDNETRNEAFNNSKTLYGSKRTTWGSSYGVNGSITFADQNSWVNENTLVWDKKFKGHSINILAGATEQGEHSSTYGFGSANLPNESLGLSGLDEGTSLPISTQATTSLWALSSFLGRINYDFRSKYFFTATYRADGSSKFASQNRWGYFPSGALAWRFSDEDFIKKWGIFSDGKLRVSYGVTGNNRVSDFGYLSTYSLPVQQTYVFNNVYQPSIVPLTIANPNLKWESTSQMDAGLDLGFFHNRLSVTTDVYRKKTSNLLLNAALPYSTGFTTAYKNIGSMRNQGFELALQGTPVQNARFSWTSAFNIAFNGNKVLSLTEGQESITSAVAWDNDWSSLPAYITKIGQSVGSMYGYIWQGEYQYNDFNKSTNGSYTLKDNVPTNGNTRGNIKPGDIKYKDINGDGTVDPTDYTVIGRGLPIHTGGFNNSFTYRGFDLNIFLQWSYGNDAYDINRLVFEGNAFSKAYLNQFASYDNRWTPTHTNTNLYRTGGFYGGGYSSRTVEDASYLRLKTLALGYSLSPHLLKRTGISRLRVYASAQNVLTFTKYQGLDPEVSNYNSVLTPGFDFSSYPRARTVTFGANVTF